jgi:hypothetical protein
MLGSPKIPDPTMQLTAENPKPPTPITRCRSGDDGCLMLGESELRLASWQGRWRSSLDASINAGGSTCAVRIASRATLKVCGQRSGMQTEWTKSITSGMRHAGELYYPRPDSHSDRHCFSSAGSWFSPVVPSKYRRLVCWHKVDHIAVARRFDLEVPVRTDQVSEGSERKLRRFNV